MTTDWSGEDPREIHYPLTLSEIISGDTPLDAMPSGVFIWPDDPDERTIVLMSLSQREHTALSSAVDVGRDIAYGQDSLKLWWLWVRSMVEVPQICEMIIECISSDPDTLRAIVDALREDDEFKELVRDTASRSTGGQTGGELFGGDCDYDVVAGRCLAIVERLNTNNEDFLEIVEVGTNDEERISALLAAIPVLSESPIDEILDFAQGLLEDFTENYAAAVTEGWKEEVASDLFCLALEKDGCALTYEDLFDYFSVRAGSNLTVASVVKNIVQFVINGDFSTDDLIASGMYAIQLAFICAGRDFFGISIPKLSAITRDAGPSSAWQDWRTCSDEGCTGAKYAYDFRNGEGGWVSTPVGINYANYHPSEGWGPNDGAFRISINKSVAGTVDRVRVYYNVAQTTGNVIFRQAWASGWGALSYTSEDTGIEDGLWYIERGGLAAANTLSIETLSPAFPPDVRLVKMCIWVE